jgi:NADH:ubiquinone oxidoreductase subunit B-like Fe-S oxidoreductase
MFAGSPVCLGGAATVVPVDVWVAGCQPTPISLLRGLPTLLRRD